MKVAVTGYEGVADSDGIAFLDGCQTTDQTIAETGTGGNNGQCDLYDGCPSEGQVALCTFTGLGQDWSGSATCPACIGTGAHYPSATQLEVAFFLKKYAW